MGETEKLTRRGFLGAAGAATAGAVAGCTSSAPANSRPGHPAPHASVARMTGIKAENARPGERHWWIRHTGAPGEVQGFTGQASARRGEPVTLYVSTTAREFRVTALRMGWYGGLLARRVWHSGWVRGHVQRHFTVSAATRTVSCAWEPSLTLRTDDWPEGTYLLRLDARSGAQRYVPLTIRSDSTAGKVVLKNAVATWQAYNTWGGYDLYTGPRGYNDRSFAVSLDRPYDGKGANEFLVFERKLINLAEKLGLPLGYVTSTDLDREPDLLHGAAALISMGHDEYWSPAERAHVTAARNAGVNVAFFGANAMFRRVRMAPAKLGGPERLVICYKTSYTQDPMYGKDNALVTSDWREPPHRDPESSLTGTLYESNPVTADYVVISPESWVFAGTGARAGTRFKGLVGDEYDRVNPRYPVPRPIEVLAHSPLTCRGVHSYADSAYYTHAGGAGVFNTGTMRWVESLAAPYGRELVPGDARFTRKVAVNVLTAFSRGPAAHRYQAKDNLTAMHEWPGDPIAAHHNLWPPIVR
ncbi:MAG TPA: N,N-dimethylformamidase beta subunit family domain-containing protein [Streptosporangiaceae bacterium]